MLLSLAGLRAEYPHRKERSGSMMTFQDSLVVVSKCNRITGSYQKGIRKTRVINVVAHSCESHCKYFELVQPLSTLGERKHQVPTQFGEIVAN